MEYKHVSKLEIKSVEASTGQFTGYLAVFGNVDSDGDVIVKGAFKVSLASKRLIPLLWQHTITEPIGIWIELAEDDHGLLVTGQLAMDTELGARNMSLVKMALDAGKEFDASGVFALSIGNKAIQWDRQKGIRYLREVKLFEGSFVTLSSNPKSNITSVKGLKAMDFNTALAANLAQQEMSDQRWAIEDACSDALRSIMEDDSLDKPAKKKAALETLHQAADARAELYAKMIDAMVDGSDDGKSGDEPPEVKAAKKAANDAIAMHMDANYKCMKAMNLLHEASALTTKGIVLARQLSYSGIAAGDDKTPPAPAGAKSAKPSDEEQLTELSRVMQTARSMFSTK